jgi:DNA segregation ATPase FtsK/SpoIIIE, S-DNA-T family
MTRPSKTDRRYESESRDNNWLDRLAQFNSHFGRFMRDALGVALIAFALMSFLALSNFTDGVLLTPWADMLALWFGWGAYLVVLAIGYSGFSLLRRARTSLPWGRLFALELAAFLTLGLLAAFGGNSLIRAEAGADGGRIGWGLITLFWRVGKTWGTLLLFGLWLLAMMSGFNLWVVLEHWLLKIAGEERPVQEPQLIAAQQQELIPEKKEAEPVRKKPAQTLPPEFRKSLKVSDNQDKKPAEPRKRDARLPSLNMLLADQNSRPDERTINQTAGMIEKTLAEFGIVSTVVGFRIGPTVTQFAVQPGFMKKQGATTEEEAQQIKVRVAQIASLQKDLTLALSAQRIRIEAPVPGKPYVGIEVPNSHQSNVRLRPLLETEAFHKIGAPLALALGRDVSGQPLVADLARMPHLLIAGATGSGKSICITSLAVCLAMNNSPEDLRMVMIDAKMVELLRFNGLPHLYGKVETNVDRILGVLRWVVVEMEHRYRLLESAKARDLETYNRQLRKKDGTPLPRIVVLIDELADLMMSAPDQTEHNLVRLAQMARATGIHLIVATQRPSTDVVTGLIKANFPARLAFAVASGVDSRVILDTTGADSLLGRGDLLFLNPEVGNPIRAQGVYVTDMEIERVIAHWQKNVDANTDAAPWEKLLTEPDENEDEGLIEQAVSIVRSSQRASASLLQRRLRIGYPRAARLLDQLEEMGVVGPSLGGGKERDVLVSPTDEEEADKGGV